MTFREVIEVVLGLGGVFGISWWLPASWRPSHLIFCALFLVVFAIAVRSQASVAYGASLLAAIGYGMLMGLRPELRAQPGFFYLALEPFLLLVSGVGASDLLRWQRSRLVALERRFAEAEGRLRRMKDRHQALVTINETLERQVVGQPTSLATMSEKLAGLWKVQGRKRSAEIVEVLASALEAQTCAVYMLRDGLLRLEAEQSIERSTYGPVLQTDDPLIRRVIEHCRVCTIRDILAEEKRVEPDVAVIAGPLVNRAGELIGVVRIDTIPLLKFTPGLVRLFTALLQIASLSLSASCPEQERSNGMNKAHLL